MNRHETLKAHYLAKIESADWAKIAQNCAENPTWSEGGDIEGTDLLGSVLSILPSGKIYAPWTSNQTRSDVTRDMAYTEALEQVAEKHGLYITEFSGDLFAGVFLDDGAEAIFWHDRDRDHSVSGWYQNSELVARNWAELEQHMAQEGVYPGLYTESYHGDLEYCADPKEYDGYEQDGDAPDPDAFTSAYIECMLWADLRDDKTGEPLEDFDASDLSESARLQVYRDCRDFRELAWGSYRAAIEHGASEEQAGRDFWLTRQRHGAGFWDRPEIYGQDAADKLMEWAHSFGEQDPYVSDSGEIEIN